MEKINTITFTGKRKDLHSFEINSTSARQNKPLEIMKHVFNKDKDLLKECSEKINGDDDVQVFNKFSKKFSHFKGINVIGSIEFLQC